MFFRPMFGDGERTVEDDDVFFADGSRHVGRTGNGSGNGVLKGSSAGNGSVNGSALGAINHVEKSEI